MTERDTRILYGSALTIPFRQGWRVGWSESEVEQIIRGNEAAALVVATSGGVRAWIAQTGGGTADPQAWPFAVPTLDEWYARQRARWGLEQ